MLERMQSKRNSPPLLEGMQTFRTTLEISMEISQKIGIQPDLETSNTTLRYMSKGCSIVVHGHLFNYVHSSIIVIARTWKQPKSPSTKDWMNKMLYICTVEDYSAVKDNGILKFACNG